MAKSSLSLMSSKQAQRAVNRAGSSADRRARRARKQTVKRAVLVGGIALVGGVAYGILTGGPSKKK